MKKIIITSCLIISVISLVNTGDIKYKNYEYTTNISKDDLKENEVALSNNKKDNTKNEDIVKNTNEQVNVVTETSETSGEQEQNKKTETNKAETVPQNKTTIKYIRLNQSGFKKPSANTFGGWITYADTLYNALMNKEDFFLEFDFNNKEECQQFQNLVYNNMVPKGTCLYDAYSHGYDIHKAETGNTFTEYHRVRYDYSWVKTKNTDIYQIESLAYNACISAGLYNGMSEDIAIRKISDWIKNNMSYVENDGDAYIGFTTKQGQCWTYAEMFNAMCGVASIEAVEISGYANGGGHAWNKAKINGEWYYFDITWYDTGYDSKYIFSKTLWSTHTI